MTKRNITTYWLLLTGLLLLVTAAMVIRPTRSHYINTTVWNTALYAEESQTPTSDCLVAGGQTILLGELKLTDDSGSIIATDIPFTLTGPSEGTVEVSSQEDISPYLIVLLDTDGNTDGYQTATAVGTQTVTMSLVPTTAAHEAMEISLLVKWVAENGTTLEGTFCLTLPEVIGEMEDTGGDDAGEVSGDDTGEASGDGTDDASGESADGTDTEAEEQGGTPTVSTTPEAVTLTVTAPAAFTPEGTLPVSITAENAESLTLGMARKDENETWSFCELPAGTRYTRWGEDVIEGWTMLYYGGTISLDPAGGGVLLDFSRTSLDLTAAQTIRVQAYSAGALAGQAEVAPAGKAVLPTEKPVQISPRVVTATQSVRVDLPAVWSEAGPEITVTDTADTEIDLTAAGLAVTVGENKDTLTISGDGTTAPGTYKLRLRWSWQGVPFAETRLTFFVNYVVDARG